MNNVWESLDESMIYPNNRVPIPYFIWVKRWSVSAYKMVLGIDAPKRPGQLQALVQWGRVQLCRQPLCGPHRRDLAEAEFTSVTGIPSSALAEMVERGHITIDIVFADELLDVRIAKLAPNNG